MKIDEALGPLLEAMGGQAPMIRVLDIRGTPRIFSVKIGEQKHEWPVDGVETLIDTLNRAFRADPAVKALVLLGEWEDMIQVWAVPKPAAAELLECEWFKPSNPKALRFSG